eukprot:829527-Alexandrium_andersonii.AAC.1
MLRPRWPPFSPADVSARAAREGRAGSDLVSPGANHGLPGKSSRSTPQKDTVQSRNPEASECSGGANIASDE